MHQEKFGRLSVVESGLSEEGKLSTDGFHFMHIAISNILTRWNAQTNEIASRFIDNLKRGTLSYSYENLPSAFQEYWKFIETLSIENTLLFIGSLEQFKFNPFYDCDSDVTEAEKNLIIRMLRSHLDQIQSSLVK